MPIRLYEYSDILAYNPRIPCVYRCFYVLRTYAGGVHLNSFKACFTCSVAVQVMILQINNKYPLELFVAWGIILVSSICIWKLSPVENINHELEREEKEHCRKVTGKILGVILIAAGCCTTLGMKKYISLIALTALTVFISQCIGIIKYKVEKRKLAGMIGVYYFRIFIVCRVLNYCWDRKSWR